MPRSASPSRRGANREPDSAELVAFVAFRGSLDGICRVLLASDEFLYLD